MRIVRKGVVDAKVGIGADQATPAPGASPQVAPPNDDCVDAIAVGDGVTAFDTTDATTDGPALPAACNEGSGVYVGQDIWYCYTANYSGTTTFSLCGSSYDTK